ncbi:MAG: class II aldolase/adducin family protein [Actinomycetota bacterium]
MPYPPLAYPPMPRRSEEPTFATVAEERLHRQRHCALAYRMFAALGWGQTGDGHISARDPERQDHFWLLRFGVPFGHATVDDLVLVAPDGSVVDGDGEINETAYHIHMPIHDARPEVVSVAHTHTAYGTPWSANVQPFRAISQEACCFVHSQSIFDGEELNVVSYEEGTRIAEAMGATRLCILRNHGLLVGGESVATAVGFYVMAERVAETHVKAPDAVAISEEGSKRLAEWAEKPSVGRSTFEFLLRSVIPDPSVVG